MNKDECRAMCTSPQIPLREKLFFRMIYETTTRPREVLEARIELWNRNTGEITFPKGKYNRWTRRHIPGAPKTMKLTGNTSEMLRHYVGNRKRGHIFINGRTGKRLTLRHFEKMIDKWARLQNTTRRRRHGIIESEPTSIAISPCSRVKCRTMTRCWVQERGGGTGRKGVGAWFLYNRLIAD